MSTYRYDTKILATNALVNDIFDWSGVTKNAEKQDIVKLYLGQIMHSTMGLPITEDRFGEDKRSILGRKLFGQALQKAIAQFTQEKQYGYFMVQEHDQGLIKYEIFGKKKIKINIAIEEELEPLPVIGPVLASKIVEERMNNGAFQSQKDLINRISGIGESNLEKIQYVFDYSNPVNSLILSPTYQPDVENNFKALFEYVQGDNFDTKLMNLLEIVRTLCTTDPSPFFQEFKTFEYSEVQHDWKSADDIGVLPGSSYFYHVKEAILDAQSSIKVCLFHIAFPDQSHPTRELLDALIDRQSNGVSIKVLLDQDEPEDPYLSTVINTPAMEYLITNGVDCRMDSPENLLHSKYIIIDDEHTIIGSHNWSAGSYFQFDDLSFHVKSVEFSQELGARFDGMFG